MTIKWCCRQRWHRLSRMKLLVRGVLLTATCMTYLIKVECLLSQRVLKLWLVLIVVELWHDIFDSRLIDELQVVEGFRRYVTIPDSLSGKWLRFEGCLLNILILWTIYVGSKTWQSDACFIFFKSTINMATPLFGSLLLLLIYWRYKRNIYASFSRVSLSGPTNEFRTELVWVQ